MEDKKSVPTLSVMIGRTIVVMYSSVDASLYMGVVFAW